MVVRLWSGWAIRQIGLPWRQRRLLGHNEVPAMGGQNMGIAVDCTNQGVLSLANSDTINCLQHSGRYMYHPVFTICTASLTFNNSTFCPHSVFMCFVWIGEQTAIISLYSIDWLVFITETECVYCAVRSTFYVLPIQCIYVFFVDLRTNSDYFPILH